MTKPLVSIIVVTYNSADDVRESLAALRTVTYRPLELIVVDNRSQDQTVSLVQKALSNWQYPAQLVRNNQNFGYAKANNIGVSHARGSLVFVLNPDARVTADFLQPLVRKMMSDDQIAACQPTVYLLQDPSKINLTGKVTHFLGFDWIKDYLSSHHPADQQLTSFSGSGVLLRKKIFEQLGGFDEQYFMYFEDSDLSWRARLAGYQLWYVAASKMFHEYKYQPDESYQTLQQKVYYTERNRLYTLCKNYSWKSLWLISPAFVLFELSLLVYCLGQGWLGEKKRSYQDVWRHRHYLLQQRGLVQKLRKVSDRELTQQFVGTITFVKFSHPVVRYLLNPILAVYWRLIKLWI